MFYIDDSSRPRGVQGEKGCLCYNSFDAGSLKSLPAFPNICCRLHARGKPGAHDFSGGVPEWLKGADCKSVGDAYAGSNPASSTIEAMFQSVSYTHLRAHETRHDIVC